MKTIKKKYYLMAFGACIAAFALTFYYFIFTTFSARTDTQYIYIDSDDTADSVFAKLDTIGSRHALNGLRTLARYKSYDQNIRTGRYAITPGKSTLNTFRQLRNGQQEPIMLTVPEVRTIDRMATILGQRLMADSADIARALRNDAVRQELGVDSTTLPCLFVPNTYEVFWDVSAIDLLRRMKKEHDAFWNSERQQRAKAIGLTPDEVCTLASIVDEETANNDEKPTIAGMYLNRLKKGMLLQADPTVKFALGDFTLRRILNKHLTVDSPYNTYKYAGLPPGPIRVASVKGIDAVLNPAQHNYLYMCAKEDFSGTHNFAATLQEHMQNARRYQQALNQRGIK